MQRTTLFVVGLVLTASLAGAAGPALAQSDDDVVTLTIEVVNPSTNQRLGGVTLVATWDGGGESRVTTASNGRVFIDVPEAASVEITPDDASYTRNDPYRIRVATEREHTIEVFRKADLDVVVDDAEGPVEDARVALAQDGIEVVSGRTDADGLFQSGTVAQGRYTLTAVKPGYYRFTEEVIVAGSPEETVRIERGRVDYDIVVEDPHFDPAEPVSDATVSIDGVGEFQTDQRGGAAVLLPVNSEVEIDVSKDGYETVTRTASVNESAGSVAFDISREPSLSLTALNERVVVGEVVPVEVTNAYGEPASGVAILVDGERVARTDSNGRATVRIQESGDRSIQARQGETTSASVTIRGIGEGSEGGEGAQTATAQETTAATTAPAEGSGSSPLTTYGPIVAAIVGLLVVLGLVALYWRRRKDRTADPSAWADDPLEPTGSAGSVGFDDDTGAGATAGEATETGGASQTADETDAGTETGSEEARSETEPGDAETATESEEAESETEGASDATETAPESDATETDPDATETQTESETDGTESEPTDAEPEADSDTEPSGDDEQK